MRRQSPALFKTKAVKELSGALREQKKNIKSVIKRGTTAQTKAKRLEESILELGKLIDADKRKLESDYNKARSTERSWRADLIAEEEAKAKMRAEALKARLQKERLKMLALVKKFEALDARITQARAQFKKADKIYQKSLDALNIARKKVTGRKFASDDLYQGNQAVAIRAHRIDADKKFRPVSKLAAELIGLEVKLGGAKTAALQQIKVYEKLYKQVEN